MLYRIGKNWNGLKQVFFVSKNKHFSPPYSVYYSTKIGYSLIDSERRRQSLIQNREKILCREIHISKSIYSSKNTSGPIDKLMFLSVCGETLDSLCEYFEELIESVPHLKNADVTYSDGVLTVYLGQKYGTYVINRQTPNLQIWLSSPTSGPKRYDFSGGTWVYKHDNSTLHALLDKEMSEIANQEVDFAEKCLHAKSKI